MSQHKRSLAFFGKEANALTWLIILNGVVFVLLSFIRIIYYFSYSPHQEADRLFQSEVFNWFVLPGNFREFLTRPWTLFSYMFSCPNIWSLISNMLWLWFFGFVLQDLTGNEKIVPVYIYGGIAGALFFLLANALLPGANAGLLPLQGPNTSVMAVVIATTVLAPRYKIFPMLHGGIPLWIATVIFVAIDYAFVAGASGYIAIAHLAGGVAGFLYMSQLKRGHDSGAWMHRFIYWCNSLFDPEKKKEKILSAHYRNSNTPGTHKSGISQQRIDEILDKINQQGYELLSKEEKELLKRASED